MINIISFDDRMDSILEIDKKNDEQIKRQQRDFSRENIKQEKFVINELAQNKKSHVSKMKSFFKVGIGAGIAALGLTAVAPVIAAGVLAVAAISVIKAVNESNHAKESAKDMSFAKKNVNVLIGKSSRSNMYETVKILELRKKFWFKEPMAPSKYLIN
jgi:hypothetical protein